MKELYNQIELHYYFSDNYHGFDAITRNECEKELLYLFEEVSNDLDIKILVEATPSQNGGFIEVWQFIGQNKEMITLLVAVLTLIMSRFPVQNKKLSKLQIENLELDNQIKREELNKLGIKNLDKIDDNLLNKIIEFLIKNYKIIWRRSNFFKKITQYKRINRISVNNLMDFKNNEPPKEITIGEFEKFILFDEEIPDIKDNIETIDLISSALKQGKFKWKGFLNNQIVDFEMKDEKFKQLVFQGDIKHNNNLKLKVNLNHSRKIDDSGKIKITKFYVNKVFSYSINNVEYQL